MVLELKVPHGDTIETPAPLVPLLLSPALCAVAIPGSWFLSESGERTLADSRPHLVDEIVQRAPANSLHLQRRREFG